MVPHDNLWIGMILTVEDDTIEIIFADRTFKIRSVLAEKEFAREHGLRWNELFVLYGIVSDCSMVTKRVIKLPNQYYKADTLHDIFNYAEEILESSP